MTALPHIGRKSITGLSVKALGVNEYQVRYKRLHGFTPKRRWTGLSDRALGHARYIAAWRKLMGRNQKGHPRKYAPSERTRG